MYSFAPLRMANLCQQVAATRGESQKIPFLRTAVPVSTPMCFPVTTVAPPGKRKDSGVQVRGSHFKMDRKDTETDGGGTWLRARMCHVLPGSVSELIQAFEWALFDGTLKIWTWMSFNLDMPFQGMHFFTKTLFHKFQPEAVNVVLQRSILLI